MQDFLGLSRVSSDSAHKNQDNGLGSTTSFKISSNTSNAMTRENKMAVLCLNSVNRGWGDHTSERSVCVTLLDRPYDFITLWALQTMMNLGLCFTVSRSP
jgi:hypothetical protein